MKRLFFLLLIVAAAVAVYFVFRNQPQAQRFEKTTHSSIEQTEHEITNAVKAGTQKADELKTNMPAKVRAGLRQANKVATNAFAQVKEATTNAVHQVKKAIGDSNQ